MARLRYNKEMISFLRDGYKQMRVPALTIAFNQKFGTDKSAKAIKTAMTKRNITCGRPRGFLKGENIKLLTQEQVVFVKREYQKISLTDLVAMLNTTFDLTVEESQLRSFLRNHKITSGRTGCFEKGSQPWNTGTAGSGICKVNSGSFQKGSRPQNHKSIGYERICKKQGYVLIKVAEANPWDSSASGWFRFKHIVEWEKLHGPISDGCCLRFLDGDKENCDPENLVLVSRGENFRLTKMDFNNYPAELKPTLVNLARVDQAVCEKTRDLKK